MTSLEQATLIGLTQAEAEQRLAKHGSNELPEKPVKPLLKLLTYFNGPIS